MNKIRLLREEHEESQIQLAEYLGIGQPALSQWENNKANPPKEMLFKIADRYGVSTDYLLGYSESREFTEPEPVRLLREYMYAKTDREFSTEDLAWIDNIISEVVTFAERKNKRE